MFLALGTGSIAFAVGAIAGFASGTLTVKAFAVIAVTIHLNSHPLLIVNISLTM